MVKPAGQKRAQPDNDPHHTTLHFVQNRNQQKRACQRTEVKKAGNRPATKGAAVTAAKAAGGLCFSASRAPKRLSGSRAAIPLSSSSPRRIFENDRHRGVSSDKRGCFGYSRHDCRNISRRGVATKQVRGKITFWASLYLRPTILVDIHLSPASVPRPATMLTPVSVASVIAAAFGAWGSDSGFHRNCCFCCVVYNSENLRATDSGKSRKHVSVALRKLAEEFEFGKRHLACYRDKWHSLSVEGRSSSPPFVLVTLYSLSGVADI